MGAPGRDLAGGAPGILQQARCWAVIVVVLALPLALGTLIYLNSTPRDAQRILTAAFVRTGDLLGARDPVAQCDDYAPLYTKLDIDDLGYWHHNNMRIMSENLDLYEKWAFKEGNIAHTYIARVAVVDGRVYLRRHLPRPLTGASVRLGAYLADIVEAVAAHPIGDAEFIVSMADKPHLHKPAAAHLPFNLSTPILMFNKNDEFAEFTIPSYDFRCGGMNSADGIYEWRVNESQNNSNGLRGTPWDARKPVAIGRWSWFCPAPYLAFPGQNPPPPCPRGHVDELVQKNNGGGLLDVGPIHPYGNFTERKPFVPLKDQCDGYKYIVTTDGWAASLKLEKLLLCGSTIVKQESAARGFYYHALTPGVHYWPFYKNPDDLLERVQWLRDHDKEAQEMGAAAQRFALKYLSRDARRCYMARLLNGLSELMAYTPVCDQGHAATFCLPAEQELDTIHFEARTRQNCDVKAKM